MSVNLLNGKPAKIAFFVVLVQMDLMLFQFDCLYYCV